MVSITLFRVYPASSPTAESSPSSGASSAAPLQPIHTPPRWRSTGSRAVTSPPLPCWVRQRPESSRRNANGRRLDTTISRSRRDFLVSSMTASSLYRLGGRFLFKAHGASREGKPHALALETLMDRDVDRLVRVHVMRSRLHDRFQPPRNLPQLLRRGTAEGISVKKTRHGSPS